MKDNTMANEARDGEIVLNDDFFKKLGESIRKKMQELDEQRQRRMESLQRAYERNCNLQMTI